MMPGLPALPFLFLAGLAGGGAWLRYTHPVKPPETDTVLPPPVSAEAPISDTMRIDMIRVGARLRASAAGRVATTRN